ncbi:MAG: flagellin [Acetobacteraceae bacterium]|jgi:flagellar hook-associated protein 3 FlgL
MSGRISTIAAPLQQEYLMQAMNSQLNTLTAEASSGLKVNPAGSMGNDAALLYSLQMQADQQNTLQTTATNAGNQLDAAQDALNSIASAVQTIANASINTATTSAQGQAAVATQASSTMSQVLDLLNTQYDGNALFAGDATSTPPMQSANAPGGPLAAVNAVLSAAVTANGGQPLTAANVQSLLTGPNGLSSIFNNTNSNPALNYNSAFYTAPDDGKPTQVLIGQNQSLSYSVKGNQPAFTNLMQGLSMLTLLAAPSTQLDSTAKSAILTQATSVIGQAQNDLITQQGQLGAVQEQLQQVATAQQTAASNTTQQITKFEAADQTAVATQLSALQTQLQASYQVTADLSQLTLSHYLPTLMS